MVYSSASKGLPNHNQNFGACVLRITMMLLGRYSTPTRGKNRAVSVSMNVQARVCSAAWNFCGWASRRLQAQTQSGSHQQKKARCTRGRKWGCVGYPLSTASLSSRTCNHQAPACRPAPSLLCAPGCITIDRHPNKEILNSEPIPSFGRGALNEEGVGPGSRAAAERISGTGHPYLPLEDGGMGNTMGLQQAQHSFHVSILWAP